MRIEIREDVREYILSEVNLSLARLGISEPVQEKEEYVDKYNDLLKYKFESAPIRQQPMMFKKLIVDGYMVTITPKEEDGVLYECRDKQQIVVVRIEYAYEHFDMGRNGCSIGRMIFLVDKDLPKAFNEIWIRPETYIRKYEGLEI